MILSWVAPMRSMRAGQPKGPDSQIRSDAFSPHALSSALLQLCNACEGEILREVWECLAAEGVGGKLEDRASENTNHLARRRIVGFGQYGSRQQVSVEMSMWLPRAYRLQGRFIDVSTHFFGTEIYCRQGDGYDELRHWLLVKSQGEGGVGGDGAVGGVSREPLLEGSRVDQVLVTERRVREPQWGALLSVVKVSAPWGWGMEVAAVTPLEHDGGDVWVR